MLKITRELVGFHLGKRFQELGEKSNMTLKLIQTFFVQCGSLQNAKGSQMSCATTG
jgi:hypothetical protein